MRLLLDGKYLVEVPDSATFPELYAAVTEAHPRVPTTLKRWHAVVLIIDGDRWYQLEAERGAHPISHYLGDLTDDPIKASVQVDRRCRHGSPKVGGGWVCGWC